MFQQLPNRNSIREWRRQERGEYILLCITLLYLCLSTGHFLPARVWKPNCFAALGPSARPPHSCLFVSDSPPSHPKETHIQDTLYPSPLSVSAQTLVLNGVHCETNALRIRCAEMTKWMGKEAQVLQRERVFGGVDVVWRGEGLLPSLEALLLLAWCQSEDRCQALESELRGEGTLILTLSSSFKRVVRGSWNVFPETGGRINMSAV